jgi:hypothetical protein
LLCAAALDLAVLSAYHVHRIEAAVIVDQADCKVEQQEDGEIHEVEVRAGLEDEDHG